MGATLDYTEVQAQDSKQAVTICRSQRIAEFGTDPYSGTLGTISDWTTLDKDKFSNSDEFYDWVEENGDKWDGYVWEISDNIFGLCGWCSC